MKNEYRIERGSPRPFSAAEARSFLSTWYRVATPDGATVAYVPDETTARQVVRAVSGR